MNDENIETIYFGGGTPSLLDVEDLKAIMHKLSSTFRVDRNSEVTIETNPDDITGKRLEQWKDADINRLSIGVQSFFDEDLEWMNRAHTAQQAIEHLQLAMKHFENVTIDLIYGTPLLTNDKWKSNVDRCTALGVPHLSCYALTVEPKTPLYKKIRNHQTADINSDQQSEQFLLLMQWLEQEGYEQYEISNFAKPAYRSRHNSSYWQGQKYLGIGPSAHSFDGRSRQWNVSNNNIYIDAVGKGTVPFQKEVLTPIQKLNEYIMTSLRTIEGLHLDRIRENESALKLRQASSKFVQGGLMIEENDHLKLTRQGRLLADGIAAELFFDNAVSKLTGL